MAGRTKATILDIAREAGVSKSTVSLVLQGSGLIRPENTACPVAPKLSARPLNRRAPSPKYQDDWRREAWMAGPMAGTLLGLKNTSPGPGRLTVPPVGLVDHTPPP